MATDSEISAEGLAEVIDSFVQLIADHGTPFPMDPRDQLWGGVRAVFDSWNVQRARDYRRLAWTARGFRHRRQRSGDGVWKQGSRTARLESPSVGVPQPAKTGSTVNIWSTPRARMWSPGPGRPRRSLRTDGSGGLGEDFPDAFEGLQGVCDTLEHHRRDMQDVEFTVEHGKLYMLQTRDGKRTGAAAMRIAVEMVEEGLIDKTEAVQRVDPNQLTQLLAPVFDPEREAEGHRGW